MQLLQEVAQTPQASQRDLSKRIGVALGLTNLMLRRLATKDYIKIMSAKKGKIRYMITPQGFLEKSRLTYEFIQYSLDLYGKVRRFLREELTLVGQGDRRRIVLCGTDELAELACLTIQEMGLELVGVVDDFPERTQFLGYPVRRLSEIQLKEVDQFVVASFRGQARAIQQLSERGVLADRIVSLSLSVDPLVLSEKKGSPVPVPRQFPLKPMETDVIVLCGGKGTRLGSLTTKIPKPLLPIGEYPFLLRLLRQLEQEGFRRFILAAHYLPGCFQDFVDAYGHLLPAVQLVIEPEPLGTGGALRHAVTHVRSSPFVVLNGDSWVSQPIAPVLAQHQEMDRNFTVVAVRASQVEGGAINKGVWRIGSHGEVTGFDTEEMVADGWVNAGVYILDRSMVVSWPVGHYSLEENLPSLLSGKKADVFCSDGHLLDIGTPQTYGIAPRVLESSGTLSPVSGS